MIDLEDSVISILTSDEKASLQKAIGHIFVTGEDIVFAEKGVHYQTVFTNKRLILLRTRGKKHGLTSIPYSSIKSFSLDIVEKRDSVLELHTNRLEEISLEFDKTVSIGSIAHFLSSQIL